MGEHPTQSGFTAVMKLSQLEGILKAVVQQGGGTGAGGSGTAAGAAAPSEGGSGPKGLMSLQEFHHLMGETARWPVKPFLFAGACAPRARAGCVGALVRALALCALLLMHAAVGGFALPHPSTPSSGGGCLLDGW